MTLARHRQLAHEAGDMLDQLKLIMTPTNNKVVKLVVDIQQKVAEIYKIESLQLTDVRGQAISDAAEIRRQSELFHIEFRDGGVEELSGWDAVCKRTGLKEKSLRVMLSAAKNRLDRLIDERPCAVIRVAHRRAYENHLAASQPAEPTGPKTKEPKGMARLKARLESRRFE